MRRFIGIRASEESGQQIDLTPMLDVVFIMLIFFIVTASFIKEAGITVERPPANTLEDIKNQKIFIALSPDDDIWIDKQVVKPVLVKGVIERLRAENPLGAVIIQADTDSSAGVFALVFDAARDAGVPAEHIHIATVDE
jgi:biopolymer transport protein ExbD